MPLQDLDVERLRVHRRVRAHCCGSKGLHCFLGKGGHTLGLLQLEGDISPYEGAGRCGSLFHQGARWGAFLRVLQRASANERVQSIRGTCQSFSFSSGVRALVAVGGPAGAAAPGAGAPTGRVPAVVLVASAAAVIPPVVIPARVLSPAAPVVVVASAAAATARIAIACIAGWSTSAARVDACSGSVAVAALLLDWDSPSRATAGTYKVVDEPDAAAVEVSAIQRLHGIVKVLGARVLHDAVKQ
jgi:hypothetical protein